MKFLLSHRFKKIGIIIAPIGFFFWCCMQKGYVTQILVLLFGSANNENKDSLYHIINVTVAIFSFFSFLFGIYFTAFSKEKFEDELVERTRLESFQFAALLQLIASIVGFFSILVIGDPKEGGLMSFFIALVFLFWLAFIGRFHYILHIKFKDGK